MSLNGHSTEPLELHQRQVQPPGSSPWTTPVDRDLQVVQLVARFEAMTASQISGVLFAANASPTPCKRVLRRLLKQKYLALYKWRVTTNRAGSASRVFQLGSYGWRYIGYESAYKRLEAFDRHKLAIADFYVALVALERVGLVEVLEVETEPNNWERVGHTELRPDLYARICSRADRGISRYWFEVDLGSEHERQIKAKCHRYRVAWENADPSNPKWQTFPRVVWVAQTTEGYDADLRRKAQLERWVGNSELFHVCTAAEVPSLLVAP
jgi:hypothetical protein